MPEDGILKRIEENCKLLYDGYSERVDYVVAVAYHRDHCKYFSKSTRPQEDCECPSMEEGRVRRIRRECLLDQLQEFAKNRDTDRNAKAERAAPRVKKAKLMPELNGFLAYDEIVSDIYSTIDRMLVEAERDRKWGAQQVKHILMGLSQQVGYFVESRPDVARMVDSSASRWVASARSALMITVGDSMFESVTCGNCGGGLATPWGNRGEADVRCVGSPTAPPCGETYPMAEWIKLYEQGARS